MRRDGDGKGGQHDGPDVGRELRDEDMEDPSVPPWMLAEWVLRTPLTGPVGSAPLALDPGLFVSDALAARVAARNRTPRAAPSILKKGGEAGGPGGGARELPGKTVRWCDRAPEVQEPPGEEAWQWPGSCPGEGERAWSWSACHHAGAARAWSGWAADGPGAAQAAGGHAAWSWREAWGEGWGGPTTVGPEAAGASDRGDGWWRSSSWWEATSGEPAARCSAQWWGTTPAASIWEARRSDRDPGESHDTPAARRSRDSASWRGGCGPPHEVLAHTAATWQRACASSELRLAGEAQRPPEGYSGGGALSDGCSPGRDLGGHDAGAQAARWWCDGTSAGGGSGAAPGGGHDAGAQAARWWCDGASAGGGSGAAPDGGGSRSSSARAHEGCSDTMAASLAYLRPTTPRPAHGWVHKEGKATSELQCGDPAEGWVTNVATLGVYVNFGAQKDALVPAREVDKLGRAFKTGDWVGGLRILAIDPIKNHITLEAVAGNRGGGRTSRQQEARGRTAPSQLGLRDNQRRWNSAAAWSPRPWQGRSAASRWLDEGAEGTGQDWLKAVAAQGSGSSGEGEAPGSRLWSSAGYALFRAGDQLDRALASRVFVL
ncbi:unnamed protein product [Prorocentrum cordatum]|uniref:S1 motif domain-containing protein n=1 Tax=Prorocentrum cordatum TaxID=2364126 RepID=A0ABN9W1L3_9DINO|nr:unnamed protein product [Polarella glacialis]